MDTSSPARGILLMLLGVSFLSLMDTAVKWALQHNISVIEVLAFRGWLIMIVLFCFVARRGGWKTLSTQHPKGHLARASIGFFAPFFFFLSLKYVPLADTVAIFFCSTFFMTAGSTLFLGEHVSIHRWSAVVIGFIGVLLVSAPGTERFHPASGFALLSGAAYAATILSGRALLRADTPFKLVFYFNAYNTILSSLLLPFFWTSPNPTIIPIIVVIAALGLSGHFSISNALSIAPIGLIAPVEYVALIWATVLGYLVWNELPNELAWLGIMLILMAGLYIVWREHYSGAAGLSKTKSTV